jgi:D-alanyl-lipoteichoic acid acyltransferase DltB (MBOAT superfamily)
VFFLPAVAVVYWILYKTRYASAAKVWLVLASLYFYSFTNFYYAPLLLCSIIVNYVIAIQLDRGAKGGITRTFILCSGISFNLGLLGYFKYSNFLLENINEVFAIQVPALHTILPLAVSFFTFQQIAYLVDRYRGEINENGMLDYCLFVMFFPKLIAGPIVYYNELMPQFAGMRKKTLTFKNLAYGISLVSIGLFKKIAVADLFARYADRGFDVAASLSFAEAWVASLSYTLQIYFDFSGYTDIAIGSAYFFNVALPINFDSPYKSLNMQEFWRRWHITLSRWLTKYLYIPLGGSHGGALRTYFNVLITFMLCGLWHGAGWTYLAWGGMHGVGIIVFRMWRLTGLKMPTTISWGITFLYVNCAWVLFRAGDFKDAVRVYKGMLDVGTINLYSIPGTLVSMMRNIESFHDAAIILGKGNEGSLICVLIGITVCVACKNSLEMIKTLHWRLAVGAAFMAVLALMFLGKENPFIYFRF